MNPSFPGGPIDLWPLAPYVVGLLVLAVVVGLAFGGSSDQ